MPGAPVQLPMVGRDASLALLSDAHAAASVDGRIATIRGEAGIGKSRLAEALAAAATCARRARARGPCLPR